VMQGTSMATPHITGVLALLLQAEPTKNSDQLRNAITGSAREDSFTGSQVSAQWGFGKVDAAAAMGAILSVRMVPEATPNSFSLLQNFPNPFNPATVIGYQLAANSFVTLKVYDELGREVARLANEEQTAGTHSARWDAANFSSGVYFYVLNAGGFRGVKKMVLMK
jgi:Subtilase family/Secretion system C-terminal sorting domain